MQNLLFLLTLALASPILAADGPATAAPCATTPTRSSAADRDWHALMDALKKASPPANYAQLSPSAQAWADDALQQRIQDLELSFIDSHPDDPRRWEIVVILRRCTPRFIKSILPAYDADPVFKNLIIDQAATKARLQRIGTLEQAMLTAADVPAKLSLAKYRPLFAARTVHDELSLAQLKPTEEIDWEFLAAKLDAYAKDFPSDREGAWIETTYLQLLENKRSDALVARLTHAAQSPNDDVRKLATGRLRIENARHTPLELKFTALDGREIDLASLRGKVVLIDFWATWCGPCIEELPNVKAAYEKYRARGFEVIGIAIDAEADREKLGQFIEREKLPWPHYFDGKKWKSAPAQTFSVSAIPATFLLDQNGCLASTAARGKNLATEIERLLNR